MELRCSCRCRPSLDHAPSHLSIPATLGATSTRPRGSAAVSDGWCDVREHLHVKDTSDDGSLQILLRVPIIVINRG